MKTKAKIAFVELVRPDCWWPQPYTIEQAFEVFRWMARTGRQYERPTRWGRNGPLETLSCAPSCTGHDSVTPIKSLADLRQRFHFGVLSAMTTSNGVNEWRQAEQIYIGSERVLSFRHHKPFTGGGPWQCEAEVQKAQGDRDRNLRRRVPVLPNIRLAGRGKHQLLDARPRQDRGRRTIPLHYGPSRSSAEGSYYPSNIKP